MDRQTYIKKIYSKYWLTAREKRYGFLDYDKNLCRFVSSYLRPKSKICDVGVGTGYPFGEYFLNAGHNLSGIDIAPLLIEKCKKLYPKIHSIAASAEDIPLKDEDFDAVYCFHSSWYFNNLFKAIDEMIRIARPGGFIFIDILNGENEEIKKNCQKEINLNRGAGRIKKYFFNIVKIVLKKGTVDWRFCVITNPSFPQEVYKYIKNKNIKNFKILGVDKGIITQKDALAHIGEFPRLLIAINK